jgi:DNA polymerase elongation subunit (family B)
MRFYTNVQMIGNQFLIRGYDNGKSVMFKEEYTPTLFVPTKKESKYRTLEGEKVESIQPGFVRDCREFYKKYEGVDGFKIYGNERYICQYISDKYPEDEIKFDISKIKLTTLDIEVASENGFPDTESASEEILLITIQDYSTKKIRTWGLGPFQHNNKNLNYRAFSTEYDLLNDFIQWWMDNPPDVITGWNVELYDVPYICRRLNRVLGEKLMKRFSPWGLVTENKFFVNGRHQISYDVGGITQLDYLNLYKKFTYKAQESYRLDYIAEVELGKKKLDHSEFDTFKDFYTNGWQKFVEYNIIDVELVDQMEDKMKLIELAITMAYDAKVNFVDVFYQVRMWDSIIYNYLKKRNIVIPPKERSAKDEKYAGAYVKEPIPGVYDWVVSFDLNSLYPHLLMQYNISPETLVEEKHPNVSVEKILNKEINFEMYKDYAICPNGAMYRKDVRGFLPELMEKIYDERVIFKKKMLEEEKKLEEIESEIKRQRGGNVKLSELTDSQLKILREKTIKEVARCNNIQMARKIQLNSAYGSLGNQYFRYYKLANAEAITLSGQVSIQWIMNHMNSYLNKALKTTEIDYVIASDTDSLYVNMGPLVEAVFAGREKTTQSVVSFLDKICQVELEKYIESSYEKLATYVNAYDQKMIMKRECIADRGIWTAKKRYILNVWDSEGVRYEEPKLKIKGIEAIKSSTPAPCRKMLKDSFNLMMSGTEDDVINFIDQCREEFKKLPPEVIAFPRSASDVVKWSSSSTIYSKGTPIHVRGALLFNHHIQKHNLKGKYSLIQNGEKIKFIFLKKPNIIQENVMSFIQEFPKELGLDKYIDYELQFEKAFLEPLKTILDAIGWKIEHTVNLDLFFA